MNIIKYTDYLNESTTNYYPGYSDDGTSDSLSKIRIKTSKLVNDELLKVEEKVLKLKGDGDNAEETAFYQKWMYANLIITSLQDGFFINKKLMDKASKYYKETLQNEFINSNKKMKLQVMEVIKELQKLEPVNNGKFYAPRFMEEYLQKELLKK